jgi:hypothetical protein
MKRGEGSELLRLVPVPWDSPSPKFRNVLANDGFNDAFSAHRVGGSNLQKVPRFRNLMLTDAIKTAIGRTGYLRFEPGSLSQAGELRRASQQANPSTFAAIQSAIRRSTAPARRYGSTRPKPRIASWAALAGRK